MIGSCSLEQPKKATWQEKNWSWKVRTAWESFKLDGHVCPSGSAIHTAWSLCRVPSSFPLCSFILCPNPLFKERGRKRNVLLSLPIDNVVYNISSYHEKLELRFYQARTWWTGQSKFLVWRRQRMPRDTTPNLVYMILLPGVERDVSSAFLP